VNSEQQSKHDVVLGQQTEGAHIIHPTKIAREKIAVLRFTVRKECDVRLSFVFSLSLSSRVM